MIKDDFSIFINTSLNLREKIDITAYGDKNNHTKCLICVHGLKGFKDWGFFPVIGEFFAEKGYYVITFNFSHNGIGEIQDSFSELDRFAENTHSIELEELTGVINYYYNSQKSSINHLTSNNNNEKDFIRDEMQILKPEIKKQVYILGHSRGGGLAILSGAENRIVDKVVSWAGVATFDRYSDRAKKEWLEKGYMEVINSRTMQVFRMNSSLLIDIEENKEKRLNVLTAAKKLNKPLLLIYAENDIAVKPEEGKQLYESSNQAKSILKIIKNTGHTFDVEHPNKKKSEVLEKIIKFTFEFLENS